MSDLQQQFEAAAEVSKRLSRRPDNQALLKLYALYKQATAGDVAGARPGMFDPVGKAKYEAWAAVKGTSRDDAMRQYIAFVNELNA
jgi:diazepam-binding inhibitor (GABA receptor modulator, acyl-CoA-binding protein)